MKVILSKDLQMALLSHLQEWCNATRVYPRAKYFPADDPDSDPNSEYVEVRTDQWQCRTAAVRLAHVNPHTGILSGEPF